MTAHLTLLSLTFFLFLSLLLFLFIALSLPRCLSLPLFFSFSHTVPCCPGRVRYSGRARRVDRERGPLPGVHAGGIGVEEPARRGAMPSRPAGRALPGRPNASCHRGSARPGTTAPHRDPQSLLTGCQGPITWNNLRLNQRQPDWRVRPSDWCTAGGRRLQCLLSECVTKICT